MTRAMLIGSMVLVVAMDEEAAPIIDALGLAPLDGCFAPHIPMRAYDKQEAGRRVAIVVNGHDRSHPKASLIGTQPATLACHLAIEHFAPDVLISAGSAGGFESRGAQIGDVYLSEGVFRFHDRLIPLEDYENYGVGSYPSLDVSRVAADLGFKLGEVTTGNAFISHPTDAEQFERYGPSVKEMEAAAVAWVASLSATPCFAIKVVSDLIDHPAPTHEQFEANLAGAVARLAQASKAVVNCCMGASLADLAAGA